MTPGDERNAEHQRNNGGPSSDGLAFLQGGGEMGERVRQKDWVETQLGSTGTWPQSLRSALSICLGSAFPIALYWGKELTLLYNDAWSPILGAKHPWGLGRPAVEVWPEIWETIGPLFQHVLETGEATRSKDQLLPMRRHGYTEECYFDYTFSPVRGESGLVGGVFNAVLETTERVVGERRLRTIRELALNLAQGRTAEAACRITAQMLGTDSADIPFALIYLLSDDAAAARLAGAAGMDPGGPMSPAYVSLGESDGSSESGWPLVRAIRTGSAELVENLESRFGPLPGGPWPESPSAALVLPITRAGRGQPYGLLVAGVSPRRGLDADYRGFFDLVTSHIAQALANAETHEEERRRAEALAKIDRAKTDFFSNVSHEFRTPLTLMLGPIESLLTQSSRLNAEEREQLATAHRNSLRLLKLVNTLLDFSRIEAGRFRGSYSPTDLSALTVDLASNFRSAMQSAGLELVVDCAPLPEPVHVDRDMWEKIVLNLLSNAYKFTFQGSVTIQLRGGDRAAVLTVSDTGAGIPEGELPHIFERFHRVEGARGRSHEGTGIGLALIQELVKLHGGSISVSSSLGSGSTFTVSLPFGAAHLGKERIERAATQPSTAVRVEAFTGEALTWISGLGERPGLSGEPVRSGESVHRRRILFADDNADMREHVKRILGQNYDVVTAADGQQALDLIAQGIPDLLVTDLMMPRVDGFELLRAVRANPATQTLPVILLSARAGEEASLEGLDAGADDYLVKPFTAKELETRVRAHLQIARTRGRAIETEAALRAEAEKARNEAVGVLESITDGFFTLDENWHFTYANSTGERLLGHTLEELRGKSHWDLYPATVGSIGDREYHRAVRDRVPVEFEILYEPWQRTFAVKAYPRERGGLSVYFRDITNSKRADEALRVSEARFRAAIEANSSILWTNDARGEMEGEQPGWGAFTGQSRDEYQGHGWAKAVHPDDAQPTIDAWHAAVADRRMFVFEHRVRRHDGEWRMFSLRAVPVLDASGEIREWVGAHTDITERKRGEQALRESEEKFRNLADSISQLAWITDEAGWMFWYNQRWFDYTGTTLEEVEGCGWRKVHHPDHVERVTEHFQEAIDNGTGWEDIFPLRGKDGQYRWFLSRAMPIRDAEGRVLRWFGTNTDITEQREIEQKLRRANADLEQFAYSASHDLQEPLRSVSIYSELLDTRYRDRLDGQALQFLGYLRNGASRMESLIHDLLAYTQVTNADITNADADARETLDAALYNLAEAMAASQARVTCEPLPRVPVQSTHLQQLFQNIIGNAIKYCRRDEPPRVHVKAERQNANWLFSIRDNGVGIGRQYQEKIFGLFKRLHTGDEYSGTGIGLAICQRIAERYHGRIWVESEPGQGSTFYFTLPL